MNYMLSGCEIDDLCWLIDEGEWLLCEVGECFGWLVCVYFCVLKVVWMIVDLVGDLLLMVV